VGTEAGGRWVSRPQPQKTTCAHGPTLRLACSVYMECQCEICGVTPGDSGIAGWDCPACLLDGWTQGHNDVRCPLHQVAR